jgi:hypothetical protein
MPRTCSVCLHPDRAEINHALHALVAGTAYRAVAGQFGLGGSSMRISVIVNALIGIVNRARETQACGFFSSLFLLSLYISNLKSERSDAALRESAQTDPSGEVLRPPA